MATLTYVTLQDNLEKQNQEEKIRSRVHATANLTSGKDYEPFKFVKISDFPPNSAVLFSYPYIGNKTIDNQDLSHRWNLIRLPKELGGDKNDISSFRAYSMYDIHIGCVVFYKPEDERLEEPCHGDAFEPVNGIAVAGFAVLNKYNALPELDLGVDDQGYIYVKQPTFEFEKNGVIGAGRDALHCTDPQEYNQTYNANQLTTRDKVKSILLSDPRIQKIVYGSSCMFMADGTLYTGNGTYRTINVDLNNTKELSASISLQGWSVVSYNVGNLTRNFAAR
ncbi:MAG: hypothetical protein KGI27_06145 [Thaumarchaeota archaeon]|nr:hypothetical protein [Nitrososphaerota archaeon]